jgi:hypothetical protein
MSKVPDDHDIRIDDIHHELTGSIGHGDSPFGIIRLQQAEIGFPFVADNLSARKAAHRNNHGTDDQVIIERDKRMNN